MRPTTTDTLDHTHGNLLIVNRIPSGHKVERSRLRQDAIDARAARLLAEAVLGTTTDGTVHMGRIGTYVLLELPPLLSQMGVGTTDELTSLVPALTTWLAERAEIVQREHDPTAALSEMDAALDAFGFPSLRTRLLSLAGSRPGVLTLMDPNGAGGDLLIPPRSELSTPSADHSDPPDGRQVVRRMRSLSEFRTHSGGAYQLDSCEVDDALQVGASARMHHPRPASSSWAVASRVIRGKPREEESP